MDIGKQFSKTKTILSELSSIQMSYIQYIFII